MVLGVPITGMAAATHAALLCFAQDHVAFSVRHPAHFRRLCFAMAQTEPAMWAASGALWQHAGQLNDAAGAGAAEVELVRR